MIFKVPLNLSQSMTSFAMLSFGLNRGSNSFSWASIGVSLQKHSMVLNIFHPIMYQTTLSGTWNEWILAKLPRLLGWYSSSRQTEPPFLLNSWLMDELSVFLRAGADVFSLGYPHFSPFHCISSKPVAYSNRLRRSISLVTCSRTSGEHSMWMW